jgi:hypothetical protein
MKHRTLGILGGALLAGGIVLGIASGIAAHRLAPQDAAAIHRPGGGTLPGHRVPGQSGPSFGDPRRNGFPAPGRPAPATPNPTTTSG